MDSIQEFCLNFLIQIIKFRMLKRKIRKGEKIKSNLK